MKTVRTRFAPSPTGYLHIGSARTALYTWLIARHYGGSFLLRIEDTDRERHQETAVDAILKGMSWLGLNHDGPIVHQYTRLNRYQEVINSLIQNKKAYHCYCSKERLEKLRNEQMKKGEKPKYDGYCRHHPPIDLKAPSVVRFKNPEEGTVEFDDWVRGRITFKNSELDDLIIARSNSIPTYNLTVVVDDWDMQITHVIRGDDHINNTPRQINLLQALEAPIPIYGHLPSILAKSGKKLSKRDNAANLLEYKEAGFLPESILNYLVRLGWSHGDQELFSLDEMIKFFDGTYINNSPAKLNQERLLWLNQHYLVKSPIKKLIPLFEDQLKSLKVNRKYHPNLNLLIGTLRERSKTLHEMVEKSLYFFGDIKEYNEKAYQKNINEETLALLKISYEKLAELPQWSEKDIYAALLEITELENVSMKKIAQPLRIAISGNTISPPIDITLALLKKEVVLKRITDLINYKGKELWV